MTSGAGRIFRVPGRIEVLGKHVDYAGGRSLLCATDRGFTFEVGPRSDGRVRLHDRASNRGYTIDPDDVQGEDRRGGPGWSKYPRAVVRRVREDFFGGDGGTVEGVEAAGVGAEGSGTQLPWRGCDIRFESDLPSSAGLSSSSAFTTGVLLSLDAASGFLDSDMARRAIPSRPDLADYIGAIESGRPFRGLGAEASGGPVASSGVGVRGGSQDHTAILCSRGAALLEACFAPVELTRYVALPSHLVFAVAVSGVRASKAAGARSRFNRLSDRATRIAELWRTHTGGSEPHLGAILALGSGATRRLCGILEREGGDDAPEMVRRVEQFEIETLELVPGVGDALQAGDLDGIGERVALSQRLAETHLGNQVPETMHLAASARDVGAVAASAFGAGFGGAVWALVDRSGVDAFVKRWRRGYHQVFPSRASRSKFLITDADDPARPLPARFG